MGSEDSKFLDLIYEAAIVPEKWPEVLAEFAHFCGCLDAVVIGAGRGVPGSLSSSPEFSAVVDDYYRQFSTENERTRRLLAKRHPGFVSDHDVFSVDELLSSPIHRDFLIPRGYGFGVATAIATQDGDNVILHAEGEFRRNRPSERWTRSLDALRPHLARSALISARMAFLKAKSAVDVLEKVGTAAAHVDHAMRVCEANQAFLVSKHLRIGRNRRLELVDFSAAETLEQMMLTGQLSRGFSLPIRNGASLAVLHAMPLRKEAIDVFGPGGTLLYFTGSRSSHDTDTHALASLFDLSPTEARIASAIGRGKTVAEIAEADRKSVQTVRNQLKRIFEKTGCRRQAELVAMISSLS